ncbi:MAG: hypothetical protein HY778_15630 [Betaproteobacteria bacterium]|nr:hypothetical protein [Betaproteobacteria bacterium]
MRLANGYTRFTGIALILGGVLPIVGMAIRPLLVEQNFNFQPTDFETINAHHAIWIVSYQVMVFGLFVRLAGLVALGSLHAHTLARTVVWPGVAIAMAAIVVNGISAGYYMHMGFWGADQLKAATDATKGAFLDSIRPGSELMICLERMAKMFFSLGLTVLGVGLALGKVVPRWLGVAGAAIGMTGMMALFAMPFSHTVFIPFDIAILAWLVVLGALVTRGIEQEPAP